MLKRFYNWITNAETASAIIVRSNENARSHGDAIEETVGLLERTVDLLEKVAVRLRQVETLVDQMAEKQKRESERTNP